MVVNPPDAVPGTPESPTPKAPEAPKTVPSKPVAPVAWAPFEGAAGRVVYDVQVRDVLVDAKGRRSYGPWRVAVNDTTATSAAVTATPGAVLEYRVQGTDTAGVTSSWSEPSQVVVATDATPRAGVTSRGWAVKKSSVSVGGTVLQTAAKGASFTAKPQFTDSITVVAGKLPTGGRVQVYVDGKLTATVSTKAARATAAQTVATVRVPYGKHTVRVVNVSGTLQLDGLAFGH